MIKKDENKNMITTVTLNPCIDLTVNIPGLNVGGLNLATQTRTDVSGKGINVSVVLRELGLATVCTGITFDGNGQQLTARLERHSISGNFAVAHGNIRTNIKLFDEEKREMTEINHRGWPVDDAVIDAFFEKLLICAEQSDIVVLSGRIPCGAQNDIYRTCLKSLHKLPVKTILDAEGEPLKLALSQKPYLIKPNLYELESAFSCKIQSTQEAVNICRNKILSKGVSVVCVSMGGEGAVIVDRERAFFAPALGIEVKGFQGAGDSMVAGVCKGMAEGKDIDDMLRYGVAAASASLIREGTLLCRKMDFERMLAKIEITEI